MRNHNRLYHVLNVLPDADPVVIEAAYKALMKRYHPDIHADGAAAGEQKAAELNLAYGILRDPERRAAYDSEERDRQERHRAELARALAAQGGAAPGGGARPGPPPPRPEPVRAGQRAAAWIGAGGVLFLAGAIYLLAQGQEPPPAAPQSAAEVEKMEVAEARALDRAAGDAFRDQPVDRAQVDKAVTEFRRISASAGQPGAAAYSEHCFDVHSRTRGLTDFDHCVAFDHVASRADLAPARDAQARQDPRFLPQSLVSRHIRAAETFVRDPSLIEARLFEIRRLADNAVSRLAPLPVQLTSIAAAPPAVRNEPVRPRAAVQRARPQPRRAQPQRRRRTSEQDFLEREGGIY
jgi:curved DNA-binding protein CbpA